MPRTPKAIREFWSWFAENENELAELLNEDQDDFASLFHPRIRHATELNWEAGGSCEFSLCPQTKEQLEEAELFVTAALPLKRWHVTAARPPKKDFRTFDFRGVRFDTEPWTYRLTAFNERRFFDIALWPEGAPAAREDLEKAACLGVALTLGDRAFVEVIDRVTLFHEKPKENATPFEHLRSHLASLAHPDVVELVRDSR